MPETMMRDPMIGEALNLEAMFLQSREERQRYIVSYKAMRDAMTNDETIRRVARAEGKAEGRAEGEAKGRAEGEAKGRAEGKAEVARRMLAMNMTPDQICQATGLSLAEVGALREKTSRG